MADRKPLVIVDGLVQQFQSNDTLEVDGDIQTTSHIMAISETNYVIIGADRYGNHAWGPLNMLRKSRGTSASPIGVNDSDDLGRFATQGMQDNGVWSTLGAHADVIRFTAVGACTASNHGRSTSFRTIPQGSVNSIEALAIRHDGDIALPMDNQSLLLGAAGDASIYYDSTDLIIDPKEVGSGQVEIKGGLKADFIGLGNENGSETNYFNNVQIPTGKTLPIHGIRTLLQFGSSGLGNMTLPLYGNYIEAGTHTSYDGNYNSAVIGFNGVVNHRGSGTILSAIGQAGTVILRDGAGNITEAKILFAGASNLSTIGSNIVSLYGLYVADMDIGSSVSYAIYTNLGDVHFGDDVEILGDLMFDGAGSGLAHGEIYGYEVADTLTISGSGVANKVQVTSFNANGVSNLTTPDHTEDHITITKAGIYRISANISVSSTGGTSYEMDFAVWKNNGVTEFQNVHCHRELSGAGGDTGTIPISGNVALAVDDTIELWCYNKTNTNNVIIESVTLSLHMIGGV